MTVPFLDHFNVFFRLLFFMQPTLARHTHTQVVILVHVHRRGGTPGALPNLHFGGGGHDKPRCLWELLLRGSGYLVSG